MRDPFPADLVPMLAKLAELPADGEGWAAEIKWDGVRAIGYCRGGELKLETRNLNDVTAQYPEAGEIAAQLGGRDAVLDGELVAFDPEGQPSFERLQQRMHLLDEHLIARRQETFPVAYVVFDLLYFDGHSLLAQAYGRRRELLEALELDGPSWQVPAYATGDLAELLAASAARKLEGLVLKKLGSRYVPGKRNGDWLKVKNVGRQEFAIGGWEPGQGRRAGRLGSILLGWFDAEGAFRYAGKVGTGFSDRALDELAARLAPLVREKNPFADGRGPRGANYVDPELVAEIEYRELTADGLVRHGSFKGLREDKPAAEVTLELPPGVARPPGSVVHPSRRS